MKIRQNLIVHRQNRSVQKKRPKPGGVPVDSREQSRGESRADMARGSGKRRTRLFQVDDEAEETGTGAEATAAPVAAEPPAQTPARVFRRPTPTTPATQNSTQTRREETHRPL